MMRCGHRDSCLEFPQEICVVRWTVTRRHHCRLRAGWKSNALPHKTLATRANTPRAPITFSRNRLRTASPPAPSGERPCAGGDRSTLHHSTGQRHFGTQYNDGRSREFHPELIALRPLNNVHVQFAINGYVTRCNLRRATGGDWAGPTNSARSFTRTNLLHHFTLRNGQSAAEPRDSRCPRYWAPIKGNDTTSTGVGAIRRVAPHQPSPTGWRRSGTSYWPSRAAVSPP